MGRNDTYNLLQILQTSVGYDIALLTTFNFDIRLFEQAILNSLFANNVRKISVYVDAEELTKSLQSVRTCQIGRKYVVNPIRINSTFHPKVVLLLGEKKARLILGSSNITTPGYTTNNEVFNFIDYTDKDPQYLDLIVSNEDVKKAKPDPEMYNTPGLSNRFFLGHTSLLTFPRCVGLPEYSCSGK